MPTSLTVQHPEKLLAFLVTHFPQVKKTRLRQWLKFGMVQVNARPITHARHPLRIGDAVAVRGKSEGPAERRLPAGLQIAFEDASLLVIEKPANLLSIATDSQRDKTAYAMLMDYVRGGNPRSGERVWIVHRLDRETSGLMVLAKSESAKRALQASWSEAKKKYLAVVEGNPPADQGTLSSHLDESGPFKVHAAPPSQRTRLAVTHYRVLQRRADLALLELTLDTGRRHQIRVQLADLGCPIVGDQRYAARTNPAGRLGLHASCLSFKHPVSGERLQFESPLPQPLARLLQ
ncbi:MAG: RluA family pseudouridine synthase [Pirellulaceae bacterium]|nr:RluA family pseudouridine synthase [Pirellulaceae bacterium]